MATYYDDVMSTAASYGVVLSSCLLVAHSPSTLTIYHVFDVTVGDLRPLHLQSLVLAGVLAGI